MRSGFYFSLFIVSIIFLLSTNIVSATNDFKHGIYLSPPANETPPQINVTPQLKEKLTNARKLLAGLKGKFISLAQHSEAIADYYERTNQNTKGICWREVSLAFEALELRLTYITSKADEIEEPTQKDIDEVKQLISELRTKVDEIFDKIFECIKISPVTTTTTTPSSTSQANEIACRLKLQSFCNDWIIGKKWNWNDIEPKTGCEKFQVYEPSSVDECKRLFGLYTTTTTTTPTTTILIHTPEIIRSCIADTDCTWLSTNCCPETAGANWECINRRSNVTCSGFLVVCPQVISPKPSLLCECIDGICGASTTTTLPQPECSTASFIILQKNYDILSKNMTLFIQNKGPGDLVITNITFGYSGGAIDTRAINRTLSTNALISVVLTDVEPNYIICSVYSNCPNVYASCI